MLCKRKNCNKEKKKERENSLVRGPITFILHKCVCTTKQKFNAEQFFHGQKTPITVSFRTIDLSLNGQDMNGLLSVHQGKMDTLAYDPLLSSNSRKDKQQA